MSRPIDLRPLWMSPWSGSSSAGRSRRSRTTACPSCCRRSSCRSRSARGCARASDPRRRRRTPWTGADDAFLVGDVLAAVAEVAASLDLGRPVGALDLGDLVVRDGAVFAQVLGLRLEVVGLRIAAFDQRLQLGVFRRTASIGRLELAERSASACICAWTAWTSALVAAPLVCADASAAARIRVAATAVASTVFLTIESPFGS